MPLYLWINVNGGFEMLQSRKIVLFLTGVLLMSFSPYTLSMQLAGGSSFNRGKPAVTQIHTNTVIQTSGDSGSACTVTIRQIKFCSSRAVDCIKIECDLRLKQKDFSCMQDCYSKVFPQCIDDLVNPG